MSATPEKTPDGELVLKAAGKTITGWTYVSVSRSVEAIPSRFEVRATTKYPGQLADAVPINSPTQILIGGKVVLTGYLERIVITLGAEEHEVRYAGRGRCCDLVDCSAYVSGMNRANVTLSNMAKVLVKPFAGPIQVITPDGDGDAKPLNYSIDFGETVYDMIERYARFEGLLVYENADGNLVLSRVGDTKHASGFTEGKNVQAIEFEQSRDERFSKYIPLYMSSDTLTRTGALPEDSGNAAGPVVLDPEIKRYRPRIIVSEQANADGSLAEQRAKWEAQRRRGRSFRATLTTDSWLDSAGAPWTPNQVAPISMPSIGLTEPGWVISDVTYKRDGQSGTTAQITLMPPEALTVEPVAQDPVALRAQNPTGTAGAPAASPTAPNAGSGDGRRDRDSYGL